MTTLEETTPLEENNWWEEEEEQSWIKRKKIGIYIGEFALWLAVFIAIIWIIWKQTDKQPEMDFVFTDESWNTQSVPVNSTWPVNAWDFSYLFWGSGWEIVTTLPATSWTLITEEIPEELVWEQTSSWLISTTETFSWVTFLLAKDCVTPWNTTVQHGDYTLAYQQRTDVPNVCNIEKRICTNGILYWSYTQWSCKEDIVYEYDRIVATSAHVKENGDLIQPSKYPVNDDKKFNEQGKLIQWASSDDTITDRVNYDNWWSQSTSSTTSQSQPVPNASCVAPWWVTISHGQFVKAYKEATTSKECEVELRFCVNGVLKWSYEYTTCTYKNMNDTVLPDSPDASSNSNNGGWIWNMISNFFRF